MKEVTITHLLDNDGYPIVSVPLVNSNKQVQLDEQDFNELIALGLNPIWKLYQSQIWEKGTSRISVTRAVADAKKNEKVSLLDGDPCNIRRNNLIISKGGNGKYGAREKLSSLDRPRLVAIKHKRISPSWQE